MILGLNLTTFNVKISMLVLEVKMPLGIIIACHLIGIAGVFSILFILMESVLIQYWTEFVWKTVKPINDKFVIVWLTMVNIFIKFQTFSRYNKTSNLDDAISFPSKLDVI